MTLTSGRWVVPLGKQVRDGGPWAPSQVGWCPGFSMEGPAGPRLQAWGKQSFLRAGGMAGRAQGVAHALGQSPSGACLGVCRLTEPPAVDSRSYKEAGVGLQTLYNRQAGNAVGHSASSAASRQTLPWTACRGASRSLRTRAGVWPARSPWLLDTGSLGTRHAPQTPSCLSATTVVLTWRLQHLMP